MSSCQRPERSVSKRRQAEKREYTLALSENEKTNHKVRIDGRTVKCKTEYSYRFELKLMMCSAARREYNDLIANYAHHNANDVQHIYIYIYIYYARPLTRIEFFLLN